MRLTNVLFRIQKRLPRGSLWRGKERLVKPVTPLISANAKAAFEVEEQNMFYLRHPYMTVEQERGHAKLFKHKERFLEKHMMRKVEHWWPHQTLGDRFGFLKVSDKWE